MYMKKWLPAAAVLAALVLLLLRPQEAARAVRDGLALCGRTVIPSLFPFFVGISLLLELGVAEALVGGYPSGAQASASLYAQGRVTRREAELLLGFCDNCGPAFLLSYVGAGILGDARLGVRLYLIHVLAALLTGVVLCRLVRDRGLALAGGAPPAKVLRFPQALTSSVFGALPVLGALEMVGGVAALTPDRAGRIAAAAIVGWGGLSVHCQAMSITIPQGLSFRWHWVGKAVQAALSALLAGSMPL